MNNTQIDKLEKIPMTNDDINNYLPNAKIMTNIDIQKYQSIDDILGKGDKSKYVIILFVDGDDNNCLTGHWVVLLKYGAEDKTEDKDKYIEFFDSYGNTPNKVYDFISDETANKLGINKYYLTELLENSPYKVIYNPIEYQSDKKDDINTCGRHCVFRTISLLGKGLVLPEYYKLLKLFKDKYKESYDKIITSLINL